MSRSSRPARAHGSSQILTIDWPLLWRRLRARGGQLFTAARHRARNTEYIPPAWMTRFRLTWFRMGLMAIALFLFTQRQVDFTVSLGKEGVALATNGQRVFAPAAADGVPAPTQTANLGILPLGGGSAAAAPAAPRWEVTRYDAATVRAYINRFERVARTEEEKFSIPAAAKMALAILESDAGRSPATRENNNHFGGVTANGYYANAWANWRAHSELIDREFPQLANESVNHQQWIAALARTNYSNDPQLTAKLLAIVERFGLDRL